MTGPEGLPPEIVVVGSLNLDLVVRTARMPAPGETILGGEFAMYSGGKGANQAVAASRAGGHVALVGAVGRDDFGRRLRETLVADRVDTRAVVEVGDSTGVAFIIVDDRGENAIVVAPGANGRMTAARVDAARTLLAGARCLLLQLEIPLPAVERAAALAAEAGVTVILDPAPVPPGGIPDELLRRVDIVTPNEHEARQLAGLPGGTPAECARRILAKGAGVVVITLGAEGVLVLEPGNGGQPRRFPAFPVAEVVDSTAAGDSFAGALAAALAAGAGLEEGLSFAQAAAAVTVTRPGAQASLPRRDEIQALLDGR